MELERREAAVEVPAGGLMVHVEPALFPLRLHLLSVTRPAARQQEREDEDAVDLQKLVRWRS